jgi:hypothetical protein
MPHWEPLGAHRYYCEDDVVFMELHGELSREDLKVLFSHITAAEIQYGYALSVYDARAGASLSPEGRRLVGERGRGQVHEGAAAVLGATFAMRTVVHLLRNASRLFGRPSVNLLFCDTPQEALTWLASERRRLRARIDQPTPATKSA